MRELAGMAALQSDDGWSSTRCVLLMIISGIDILLLMEERAVIEVLDILLTILVL